MTAPADSPCYNGGIVPHGPVSVTTPDSIRLLRDIRQDAIDFLRSAISQAEDGRWADATISSDIAHDRLVFAEDIALELEMYR